MQDNDPMQEPDQNMDNPQDMGMDPGMEANADNIGGDDSTMSIINQLSDTDREAVRAYAESMLSRDEESDIDNDGIGGDAQAPMQETRKVIFTKKQLLEMNENFGPTADELEKTKPEIFSKKTDRKNNNTPFDKPKFN
jgi:hypothetical protein